jgi:putative ABC transport system permease protein
MWAVDALVALAPADAPRLNEVRLDMTVFGYLALLTLATGFVFGLAPALQHSRIDLLANLKDGGRTASGGSRTLRRGLVVAEIALALMLVAGAGLLVSTFVRLQAADLGFRTDGVLTGTVNPPRVPYDTPAKHRVFYDQVLEKAANLPGVQQAALASVLPLNAGDSDTSFRIEGRPVPQAQSETPVTWYRQVSAGYFDAIGMPLRRGRGFGPREAAPSVVVNETFVRTYFPAEDPLGRRIRFSSDGDWFTIVGVVADARSRGAREATRVETFIPYWQLTEPGMTVVLRGTSPARFAAPLREAVASIDRNVPVVGIQTMTQAFGASIAQPRFFATLAAAFAMLALVLAAVGVYGVMSYSVARRTTEIAVRMALGAARPEVYRLVVGEGLKLALLGVLLGVGGALLVGRSLGSLLFGIGPTDPRLILGTVVLLLAVAIAACLLPAWRASRVEPMASLRSS